MTPKSGPFCLFYLAHYWGGRWLATSRFLRVFPIIIMPIPFLPNDLVKAARPRGNQGPCTVRRSHRRKLYPTCRQSCCMTKMAFLFGIAWDIQMQHTIWNRNVRVPIRRSGTLGRRFFTNSLACFIRHLEVAIIFASDHNDHLILVNWNPSTSTHSPCFYGGTQA